MDEKNIDTELRESSTISIEKQVTDILEELALTPIEGTEKELINDLALDSLRLVMLLVNLEEAFEIELDESDMNPFQLITVQDVINLVAKYMTGGEKNE